MGVEAFDLAERLQTPVFVMTDLDLGMNNWMAEPVPLPGATPRPRQGAGAGGARAAGRLRPLPRRGRRRDWLAHAARDRSPQGRVLHAGHRPRRERRLQREPGGLRAQHGPACGGSSTARAGSCPPRRSCGEAGRAGGDHRLRVLRTTPWSRPGPSSARRPGSRPTTSGCGAIPSPARCEVFVASHAAGVRGGAEPGRPDAVAAQARPALRRWWPASARWPTSTACRSTRGR